MFLFRLASITCVIFICGVSVNPILAQSLDDPTLEMETVVTGLSSPTTMAFIAPDDILVLQKNNGQVHRILNGVLQPAPVLDVAVNASSERGLLGIAVNTLDPPDVFLYYTEASSGDGSFPLGNRVYRYAWNRTTEMLEDPILILDLPVLPGPNHDGGIILLGCPNSRGSCGEPGGIGDGTFLYVIIGDLNRNGQLQNRVDGVTPDDSSVVLRVLQDGSSAPGNPFTPYCSMTTTQTCQDDSGCPSGENCVTEVSRYYAYGIRNSFGMALDPVTGHLWDTENGPSTNDEINLVAPGFNSGWRDVMGPVQNPPPSGLFNMPDAGSTYSNPEFTWFDTNAPTAIVFPVGSRLGPAYDDMALVGDNNSGQVFAFPLNAQRDGFDFTEFPNLQDLVANNNSERDEVSIGRGFGAITDLEVGPDGALYVVSISRGTIYRIVGPDPNVLVPKGAIWSYLDDGSNQGTAWREVNFADENWPTGTAQLGYGDGDEDTVVDGGPIGNRFTTTYFRHHFNVSDPTTIQGLDGSILRDDGAVVFLNGKQVFRTNVPSGSIDYLTLASNEIEDDTFHDFSLPVAYLNQGDNVLAVEIHQATPNTPDMSFDMSLTIAEEVDVSFDVGYNLYSPPLAVEGNQSCFEFQTSFNLESIQRLDSASQGYHLCDASDNNFLLEPGEGYIINSSAAIEFSLTGEPMCALLHLDPGINLIGIPFPQVRMKCFDLLLALGTPNDVSSLQRFNTTTGRFETCTYGDPNDPNTPVGTNFPIVLGEGYFVSMRSSIVVSTQSNTICGED